ncbi:MAG: glycosyltransferase family 39 protein [Candidatus Beckwithbacteria bacterium]|nr:glycosyltransferase family 39 protein [Candidatus Beckwithbacteria bacterium]
MKKKLINFLAIFFIFALTFVVRLYRINNPVADWHSWRQADTAAVARNFIKSGFNLLYPQSDSLLALNTKRLPNPTRLFINEFPFYNALVAVLYRQLGIHEYLARLVSVFFASLGAVFLLLLTKKLFGQKIGLTAALFYALNPYNIYYGRVIMPDPIFVSLSIISLYLFIHWLEKQKLVLGILLAFVFSLAMLVKPYAVFIAFPMLYWALVNQGFRIFKNKQAYLIALIATVPILLWRYHYFLHPEANFDTSWLFNQTEIRFTGAFFRWLIFERMNRLIFATGGFVLLIIGVLNSYQNKTRALIFIWFLSVILYMTIFAMGNVTHDYYQLPIMPVGSILVAFGFWHIINQSKKILPRIFNILIALSLLVISFAFGWYEVRGFFNINRWEIVKAGQAVDRLTPKDALVIAAYNSDPAFLYQTNRYGWPDGTDIEAKIKAGADYYVSVNYDNVAQDLESQCGVLLKTAEYIIIPVKNCL